MTRSDSTGNELRPHSPACERNREPIGAVLRDLVDADKPQTLFEIGSGSGQHAQYFSIMFPQLHWITSDRKVNHNGIRIWLREAGENVSGPLEYEVGITPLPTEAGQADFIFTANTFHIMSWALVQKCTAEAGAIMRSGAKFVVYGPFNYDGRFTSESNAKFDECLKFDAPERGIRDFADIEACMCTAGLSTEKDVEMPANNRLLVFVKN